MQTSTVESSATNSNRATRGNGVDWSSQDLLPVYVTECHYCGFRAADPPRTCPKCHGSTWDRFPRPGSLLERAESATARGRVRRATSIERGLLPLLSRGLVRHSPIFQRPTAPPAPSCPATDSATGSVA